MTPVPPRPAPAKLTVLLLRHGETAWTREGRYQGRSDPCLAPEGVAAAESLSATLRDLPVRRVISSPLLRARATALCVAAPHGVPVEIEPRLAEIGFGAWEGRTQAEIRLLWPDMLRQWKRQPQAVRFGSGESLADIRARLLAVLDDLENTDGMIALVTHVTVIRLALLEASGLPISAFREIEVPPASARVIGLVRGCRTRTILPEKLFSGVEA